MTDYHFKHFTMTASGPKTRLYNWRTMKPMHPSPVILAILRALVEACGEVVEPDALISSARGARLKAGSRGRPSRFAGRQGSPAASGALKQAASRLRGVLGAGSVESVRGQGYRMGWSVRLGAR